MFRSSSKPAAASPSGGKRGSFSVLGAEVTVTGNITAADLHLDGTIEGDVACGALIVGTAGRVAGSVAADSARVAGSIDGAVSVRELAVERSARITGDIAYETITIENGAQVDGQLRRRSGDPRPLALEVRTDDPPRLLVAEEKAA